MAIGSRKMFAGAAQAATLAGSMDASTLSFTVESGQGASFPDGSDGDFPVDLDRGTATAERVLCESRSGDTFTVKSGGRGHDGTSAQSHSVRTDGVTHGFDAESANDLMDAVYDRAVLKALFDANTVLAANADDAPAALTVAEDRLLGRLSGGNIAALTPAQVVDALLASELSATFRTIAKASKAIADGGSTVTVANTAAETSLLSETIPADTFAAGDVVRLRAWGDYLENADAATTRNVRLKVGGTTQISGALAWTAATSASRGRWHLTCDVQIANAAAFNRLVTELIATDTGAGTPEWEDTTTGASQWIGNASSNVDFTGSVDVEVTVEMSAADASSDVRLLAYYLEKVGA